jgi:L-cysteine:1D-myo-inositol 2-amino-2-deoxy-alpha-D-glucopyranoside ligase
MGSRLKLYDTMSGQKLDFKPLDGHTVRMYVCGVTPYDTTHVGHAMTYLTFDVLNRYCQHIGWRVKYVQNVTDIDDDILKRANRDGDQWDTLGDRHTRRLVEDLSALNVLWPQVFPRASEETEKIVELTSALVADGYAYESGGNVYFRVAADEDYGSLSKYSHAEMIELSRERGADPDDPRKEGPLDFALWQAPAAGGAGVGEPVGTGAARLAHRVLGDGDAAPGPADLRRARRRDGPGVPAPRVRDRAVTRVPPAKDRSVRSGCILAWWAIRARR